MVRVRSLSRVLHVDHGLGDIHEEKLDQNIAAQHVRTGPTTGAAQSLQRPPLQRLLSCLVCRSSLTAFLLLVVAVCAARPQAALAAPEDQSALLGRIAYNRVNLRSGPGTNYRVVGKLYAGDEVTLLVRDGDWYEIRTAQAQRGWVYAQLVTVVPAGHTQVPSPEQPPAAAAPASAGQPLQVGRIAYNRVNLRSGPGTHHRVLDKLYAGTQVTLVRTEGDWYQLWTPHAQRGWVYAKLVSVAPVVAQAVASPAPQPQPSTVAVAAPLGEAHAALAVAPPETTAAAAGNDVAAFARQFVGSRYVWGGAGPNVFDCSGLTRYVYRHFGVSLPHNSRAQYNSRYGEFVARENIQPGDLLFFVNTAGPGISHVGIYLGDGQIVHAVSPRHGVRISNINSRYWVNHYHGALRPHR